MCCVVAESDICLSVDYGLAIFEDEYHQIMGRWTLKLNRYNEREIYSHMNEQCESLAPDYVQTEGC